MTLIVSYRVINSQCFREIHNGFQLLSGLMLICYLADEEAAGSQRLNFYSFKVEAVGLFINPLYDREMFLFPAQEKLNIYDIIIE